MENNFSNDKNEDISKIDFNESNSGSPSELDYQPVDRAIKRVYMRNPWDVRFESYIRINLFALLLSIFASIVLFYNCCAAFSTSSNCHRRTQDLMFGIGVILFVLYLYTQWVSVRWRRQLEAAANQ